MDIMKKGNTMRKTLYSTIALLAVLLLAGCAISPAYSSYGPPRGGAYVYRPAPYYYAPAPYVSYSWRYGHGHGHGHGYRH